MSRFSLCIFTPLASTINTFSILNNYFYIFTKLNPQERNLTGLGRGFQARLPHSLMAVVGMLPLQF